jgi:outer membrane receptor protein involved in Fe transport
MRRTKPFFRTLIHVAAVGLAFAAVAASAGEAPETELQPFVVTASRYGEPARAVPAVVLVISSADVAAAPAHALDDVLRTVPGVNMRVGSSDALPPALQTVSMLGTGGVSRSLVMLDGIPMTDGFGGWVDWSKVPVDMVDRVEVLRGGSSSLYGTNALSGVVDIMTRDPKERAADLDLSYGSRDTRRLNAYASDAFLGKFGVGADLYDFKTAGYQWLQPNVRGPIDHNATAANWTAQLKAASLEGGRGGPLWFVRGSYSHDDRNHGLDHFYDSREETEGAAGFRRLTDASGEIRGNVFLGKHILDSTGDSINPPLGLGVPRTKEAILVRNFLPSLDSGASLQWSRPFDALESSVTVGVDLRHEAARNNQDNYSPLGTGAYVNSISSGGQQTDAGFFAEWNAAPAPGLSVAPSARVDYWRNHDAFQVDANGKAPIPSKSFAFFSPRLAARYEVSEPFALRGAVYRAFVAPNLQTLYRGASVQGQTQIPNPDLTPEVLRIGGEVGWDLTLDSLLLRSTGFWNEITDAILNVTIKPNPNGVTQAQNVGSVRTRGVVLEAPWRIDRRWTLSPSYTYTDAVITSNPSSPSTVGNMVQDIPRHQAAAALTFDDPGIVTAQLRARYLSRRWGNDLNTQNLDEHLVLDLSASRSLGKALEVYFDGENLLDRRYTAVQLGALPVLGEPLYVSLGLRLHYR